MNDRPNTSTPARPGAGAYLQVLGLLGKTVLDLVLLPFRLALFLLRRKRIKEEVQGLLEEHARKDELDQDR